VIPQVLKSPNPQQRHLAAVADSCEAAAGLTAR